MSDLDYTEDQLRAIDKISDWYRSLEFDDEGKLLDKSNQIFRLFGYAGVGKTSVTRAAVDNLGIGRVNYAAYTGKASHVMQKHGLEGASTIRSLAYRFIEASEAQVADETAKLNGMREQLATAGVGERGILESLIREKMAEIKKMKQPDFRLNFDAPIVDSNLVCLDEVSMVDEETGLELCQFDKPMLVIGDPGQLPPVGRGEGWFIAAKPDVMLTEIHRQALESPIIRLSMMAREGVEIPYGKHGDKVAKVHSNKIYPEWLLRADQVLCGMNKTRYEMNLVLRKHLGYDVSYPFPVDDKEKIICLKNNKRVGLVNGMFISLHDIENIADPFNPDLESFGARIKGEEGEWFGNITRTGDGQKFQIYAGHFLDHIKFDKDRKDRDWSIVKKYVEATFGWVITVHKMQGSQAENIIVIDDKLFANKKLFRKQWLYTAITRAEEGLCIID